MMRPPPLEVLVLEQHEAAPCINPRSLGRVEMGESSPSNPRLLCSAGSNSTSARQLHSGLEEVLRHQLRRCARITPMRIFRR